MSHTLQQSQTVLGQPDPGMAVWLCTVMRKGTVVSAQVSGVHGIDSMRAGTPAHG